ncbi:NlpC/P60 family protein [Streptomyces sp. TRM43335]|uniref:NlpC/P60 family protein n=1 Tax=Streptomyces taklimakanensis TaxID=2569853 RepID=A0A6G2BJA1_9ACTN|nr:C40 family peptidase [Streptomyces taklimakanensis]MTE22196.1 NlpC/P60 family protein [Streptomyces taklimakanensis]
MSAHTPITGRLSRAGITTAVTAVTLAGTTLIPSATPDAEAATPANKALRVAASKKGSPYQYGAAGPSRFDCSGLIQYSYKKAGKKLPRTAAAQYNRSKRISVTTRRKGDLVFFHSGGSVYHVGIYAGGGRVWHSPKPGKTVRKERIWTKNVRYGRVR